MILVEHKIFGFTILKEFDGWTHGSVNMKSELPMTTLDLLFARFS